MWVVNRRYKIKLVIVCEIQQKEINKIVFLRFFSNIFICLKYKIIVLVMIKEIKCEIENMRKE